MKVLYLDCFSGISGDMLLGGLLDLGYPLEALQEVLDQMHLSLQVTVKRVNKSGVSSLKINIEPLEPQPSSRCCSELLEIINNSRLETVVADKVRNALQHLAEAEAAIHGKEAKTVHFHELGGLDTLADLAGSFAGIAFLGIEKIFCSNLPLGQGCVSCSHGLLPLPAPATLELLKGVPTYGTALHSELVTPTGAVLATALAKDFGPPPLASWEKIGYGAGSRELPQANILRLWLGTTEPYQEISFAADHLFVLETQVDDNNPEFLPYLRERLEQDGALDVIFIPVVMKKGRPGTLIQVLSPPHNLQKHCELIFRQTTALGVRWYPAERFKLLRTSLQATTPYGNITVKLGYAKKGNSSEIINLAPEYSSCAAAARTSGAGIKEVYEAAKTAARLLLAAQVHKFPFPDGSEQD